MSNRLWIPSAKHGCALVLGWSLSLAAQAMGGLPASGGSTAGTAGTSANSATAASYTKTRYPVVFTHGLFGFDTIGPVDYFYGVPAALRADGATVYTTKVSAANTSEVRGEQLLAELRRLKAVHGHQKFNLIGHSHGGHSVRYVAAIAPELVASVLTVGSPHQGTAVADVMARAIDTTNTTPLVAGFFNMFSRVIDALGSGVKLPQNSDGALRSLSTAGSTAFTKRFPQGAPTSTCGTGAGLVNGVRYYSLSGTGTTTNLMDPDAALGLTAILFGGKANDGLVDRCSSRWGEVLRDNYPWNHMDEVNQSFGLRGWGSPDPVAVYRSHANRLKLSGL